MVLVSRTAMDALYGSCSAVQLRHHHSSPCSSVAFPARDSWMCKRIFTCSSLQGWEAARDHARSAVETDNRLRRWLPGPGLAQGPPAGLLYRCTLGNLDLTAPLGARLCSVALPVVCCVAVHAAETSLPAARHVLMRCMSCNKAI